MTAVSVIVAVLAALFAIGAALHLDAPPARHRRRRTRRLTAIRLADVRPRPLRIPRDT